MFCVFAYRTCMRVFPEVALLRCELCLTLGAIAPDASRPFARRELLRGGRTRNEDRRKRNRGHRRRRFRRQPIKETVPSKRTRYGARHNLSLHRTNARTHTSVGTPKGYPPSCASLLWTLSRTLVVVLFAVFSIFCRLVAPPRGCSRCCYRYDCRRCCEFSKKLVSFSVV